MKNIITSIFCSLLLLTSFSTFSQDTRARAYLIDGVNGTRSGPIRGISESTKLEKDRKFLIEHAQSNDRSSGIAKPGDKHWTDLPSDSIFKTE